MQLETVITGLIGGAGAGLIAGAICGAIVGWYSGWQYQAKLIEFERKLNQFWGSYSSEKGVKAREDNAAQEASLMAQAAAIMQTDDPDKLKKVAALAAQNPAIAMKLAKKMGIM